MSVEIRDYGDGLYFVAYTENEEARKRLKALPAFDGESHYYNGKALVGVDVFLLKEKLTPKMRRQLTEEARRNVKNRQAAAV